MCCVSLISYVQEPFPPAPSAAQTLQFDLGRYCLQLVNLELSLLDSSSANGQEKPAEPVKQFQIINKHCKGNKG